MRKSQIAIISPPNINCLFHCHLPLRAKVRKKNISKRRGKPQKVELLSEPVYFKLVVNNIASSLREGTGEITHPLVIEALSLARSRAVEHHGL